MEKETKTGFYIALSPKTYILGDFHDFKRFGLKSKTTTKIFFRSSKGVPHTLKIFYSDYLKCLYDPTFKDVREYYKLQFEKKISTIVLKRVQKATLSSLYTKTFLDNNKVSCKIHEGVRP